LKVEEALKEKRSHGEKRKRRNEGDEGLQSDLTGELNVNFSFFNVLAIIARMETHAQHLSLDILPSLQHTMVN